MTSNGFTPTQVAACLMRDLDMCQMSGADPRCQQRASTANHRLNRAMGGSTLRNGMSNACAICDWCNGHIEADAVYASIARHRGVKVGEGILEPADVPLWSIAFRQWVWLGDDGLELTGSTDYLTPPTRDAS